MTAELAPIARTDVAESDALGNPSAFLFDSARMTALMDFANMMCGAHVTVPKHLHGKPADCMAITLQAMRWRMDPFVVASKTHVVNGNLGYEAQLVVAVLKNSGAVKGRPHYEYRGDGQALECRAGFVPAGEADVVWTEWLSIAGITTKNSPLWKVNPKQQFGYLQARNWARLYAPDALLGIYTDDELQVIPARQPEVHMGAAEEVRPALPDYSDADFAKNLPAWTKLVRDGKKTAADLLAMLSTKAAFSEAQKKKVLALKPAQTPAPEPAAAPAEPEPTGDGVDDFVADMDAEETAQ